MMSSFEQARFNMIEQQIRPWGVLDPAVLAVMARIAREQFVPDAYQALAYADIEIPLPSGEMMLAPKIVGQLLQALAPRPHERVLEIGTGSGYVSACLAALGQAVTSLEINPTLADAAQTRLAGQPVEIHTTDAFAGEIEGGPYAVIAVTGSLPTVEPMVRLHEQLAEGGRLFVILGQAPVMQAMRITRLPAGGWREEHLFETCVPPLSNVPLPEQFAF